MSNWDPFKGETGLKDDYDGTITAAEFSQGQRGGWGLQLTVAADDGEEATLNLGCGANWTSFDGGETVEGASAKSRFNERTGYQRFLVAAMGSGAEDELRSRSNSLYGGRGPMHAALWVGLRFHFDVIHIAGQRPNEAGEWKDVEGGIATVTPTKYLGVQQGTNAPASPASGSASTSTSAPASNGAADGIHPDDLAVLKVHAASLEYAAFADKVMTLNDHDGNSMLKNKPVMTALASKDWYESLKA